MKIQGITSIKLSTMQGIQLKNSTTILIMFSKKSRKPSLRLKLFKSMVNSLAVHGQKNIQIMWKVQKLFKKVFITLQITNLWCLIWKLQHPQPHSGLMSSTSQDIWIINSCMFLFMQRVHSNKCTQFKQLSIQQFLKF